MPARQVISTPDAPAAIGTYSQAIRVGDTVWLSGQIPLDPKTMALVGDASPEATAQRYAAAGAGTVVVHTPALGLWLSAAGVVVVRPDPVAAADVVGLVATPA